MTTCFPGSFSILQGKRDDKGVGRLRVEITPYELPIQTAEMNVFGALFGSNEITFENIPRTSGLL